MILSDLQVRFSSDRRPVLGIIYYQHCCLAVFPLKVEILDEVNLSDILVICSFKIQIQGIDHQEAQGYWIFQMS